MSPTILVNLVSWVQFSRVKSVFEESRHRQQMTILRPVQQSSPRVAQPSRERIFRTILTRMNGQRLKADEWTEGGNSRRLLFTTGAGPSIGDLCRL